MRDRTGCPNDRAGADEPESPPRSDGGPDGGPGEGGGFGEWGRGRGGRDPWLPATEPFEGAAALDDLVGTADDPAATRRVLGRYAAVRLARRAAAGRLDAQGLAQERRVAAEYVEAIGPPDDEERRVLGRIVAGAASPGAPALCAALVEAAGLAAARGADGGAFVLYRTAFDLASRGGRRGEAAAAAKAVARLARARGASCRAVRWWRRNAERARRLAGLDGARGDDGARNGRT